MEEKKLTREEIALQVMCAAISVAGNKTGNSAVMFLPNNEKEAMPLVNRAFDLADIFIQERNKKA